MTGPGQPSLGPEGGLTAGGRPATIPDQFERLARRYPGYFAVRTPDEDLTFAQLDQEANRLAQWLSEELPATPRAVGLLIGPGRAHLVALLGILKAGHWYVLLRTSQPPARLARLAADSGLAEILTSHHQRDLARGCLPPGGRVFEIEQLPERLTGAGFLSRATPEGLASVTYTSGSTGQPKGVMHSHRSTLCLSQAAGEANVGPGDRVVYPGSNMGVNRAIVHGATSLTWSVRERGLGGLAGWLEHQQPTAWMSVPSVFRDFLRGLPAGTTLPPLRRVILTGEAVLPGDLTLFNQHFPRGSLLVNELGTSETKSYLQWIYRAQDPLPGTVVPVGHPLAGRTVRLLDERGEEVLPGEVGELVVHAPHMSSGYWNLPAQTSDRFREVPGMPGHWRYHTGDLARQQPSGTIELVGRRDHEIKVRGQRTNLGEIEAAMAALPFIQEAVVVAHGDDRGEITLAGFYVSGSDPAPTSRAVREALRQQLPEHMVPSFLRALPRLPRNAHGKVDRHALPSLSTLRAERACRGTPPRDDIERRLLTIWQQAFDLSAIGVDDDFHELGGHSLLATRIALAVEREFGCRLGLRGVLAAATVADLAQVVRSAPRAAASRLPSTARQVAQAGGEIPPSYAQQRMWFLEQADPGLTSYLLTHAWRLIGTLDLAPLESALGGIWARHDAWRATFHETAGQLTTRVTAPTALPLQLIDLQSLSASDREAGLREQLAVAARTPLDLRRGPLVRWSVVRLGLREHVLILNAHHAVFDAWSLDRFWGELSSLYASALAGTTPTLPDLPIQYGDFALWERERLASQAFRDQLDRSVRRLSGLPPLNLPTDRPRPAQGRFTRGRVRFELEEEIAGRLAEIAVAGNATRQMVLLAVTQLWLAVVSDQVDFGLAVPVAGRIRSELAPLLGLFVNTLVVRMEVHWPETFRELLARARSASFDAYDDEEIPFDRLVEALNPPRDPGRNPLCDVLFELRGPGTNRASMAGLEAERLSGWGGQVRFDLELHFVESAGRLVGTLDYRDELFDAGVIDSWCGLFHSLAGQVAAHPDLPCQELDLLPAGCRRQVLVDWNPPRLPAWTPATIHGLFERQVARTPHATAIAVEQGDWTYAAVNHRANQLARFLSREGVGRGDLVGVLLPHGPGLIVTLLGILKAGAGYLPLDPNLPAQRQLVLLRDARPSRIFVVDPTQPLETGDLDIPVLAWEVATQEPTTGEPASGNPDRCVNPQERAYVMYTSGSTGDPKGVEITHAGVTRLVDQVDYIELGSDTRMAVNAPLAFDASTLEIWAPLLNGGCCVPIPASCQGRVADLVTTLERDRVNTLWLTSALFNLLVDECPQFPRGISQLLVGGETLSVSHVRKALARLAPGERLFNGYGPTECTTFTTVHPIAPGLPADCRSIPIGRPVARTPVCVIDRFGRPVPPGVAGELCVGGPGLARGYLNSPDLTASKFIACSIPELGVERLYRTGDRVRWNSGGVLEFLERIDRQVKIRGFRLELADIERALERLPSVGQALVLVQEQSPAERRLVAYLQPAPGIRPPSEDSLRSAVADWLPTYMIPSEFAWLDRFPLTATGKIDQRALPAAVPQPPPGSPPRRAFQGGVEAELARLWVEVLGRPVASRDSPFFESGGTSLAAMRLLSLVESRFGKRLPVATLYQEGTIALMARAVVDDSVRGPLTPVRVRLGTDPDRNLFLMPGLSGAASLPRELLLALPDSYTIVVPSPLLDERMPDHWPDFATMIDCYVETIRRHQPSGPYLLMGYCFGGRLAFQVARRLLELGHPVREVIIIDTAARRTASTSPWGDSLARPFRILANLPGWLRDEAGGLSTLAFRSRATRWLRRTLRLDRGAPVFDRRPEFAADNNLDKGVEHTTKVFRDLVWRLEREAPWPAVRLRVSLLRARIRPLFAGDPGDLRWSRLCGSAVDVHDLPGNHVTILSPPDSQRLIEILTTILEKHD